MDFDVVCHVPLAYFPSNLREFRVPRRYFFFLKSVGMPHPHTSQENTFFRDLGVCYYVLLDVVLGFFFSWLDHVFVWLASQPRSVLHVSLECVL